MKPPSSAITNISEAEDSVAFGGIDPRFAEIEKIILFGGYAVAPGGRINTRSGALSITNQFFDKEVTQGTIQRELFQF